MSTSSSSSTACFDYTLEYLKWLIENRIYGCFSDVDLLIGEVRLMKTLFLCARNRRSNHFSYLECGCQESNCEKLGCNIPFRIKELVFRSTQDLQSAFLTSGIDGAQDEIGRFRDNIRVFWIDTWEELCQILLDEHCLVGVPDVGGLMDLVDSFLDSLVHLLRVRWSFGKDELLHVFEALKEKLMFLKYFISFVNMQGVEHVQLIEVLTAVEFLTITAARLIYTSWYSGNDAQVDSLVYFSIDRQVWETCIHVLTALKLSRSSSDIPLILGKNWQILAADFLDSILGNLWVLLRYVTSGFTISMKHKIQKLNEGVKFLSYLLREHQEKFDQLHDEMKDLIRVVVYDVGIVICSISPNEMTEGLAKETNNALFHLLEVLEFIMAEFLQFYPSFSFPMTNELGSIDFLLKTIKELASCETDSIAFLKDQIQRVQEGLVFLRSFLQSIVELRNQNDRLRALWSRVMEVAYRAEFVIDSVMVGDKPDCSSMSLDTITEEIKFLKIEAHEIYAT